MQIKGGLPRGLGKNHKYANINRILFLKYIFLNFFIQLKLSGKINIYLNYEEQKIDNI